MNLWDRLRTVQKDPRTKGPQYRPQPDPPSAETPIAAEILRRARIAMEVRQWGNAVLMFEEAFEFKKPSGADLCDYGDCFRFLGNLADAEAAYRRAIRRDPSLARTYNSLGVLLARDLGDLNEAEKMFQEAMEIDPKGPALENLRTLQERRREGVITSAEDVSIFADREEEAKAWEQQGKLAKALDIYKNFLDIYPRSVRTLNKTAELYLKLNEAEEARILLERAISLKPGFVRAWTNLSAAKMALGDYEGAQEAVEQALKLDPTDRSARWRLSNLTLQTTPPPEESNRTPPPVEHRGSRYDFPIGRFDPERKPRRSGVHECTSCGRSYNLYGQWSAENPGMPAHICRKCGAFYCGVCMEKALRARPVFKCACGKARIDKNSTEGFEKIEVYRHWPDTPIHH